MSQNLENSTNDVNTKFLKKRKWYERRSDRGNALGFKSQKVNETNNGTEPFERIKKKKFALLLGYSGYNYYGMQRNPNMRTIEEELFQSLFKNKYIPEEAFDDMHMIKFQRAARTDKGVSAVRQVVSLKLPLEIDLNLINSHLPETIRVFGCKPVTQGFDSKSSCDSRTYSYTLPLIAFAETINEEEDKNTLLESYRLPEDRFEQINNTFKNYLGTKNFYNYTSKKRFYDPSVKRYIIKFEVQPPFIVDNVQFATILVRGQSFMLHQIRKMIGLVISIFRGYISADMIEKSWTEEHIDIPMAPGLGLLLECVHYDRYNYKYGNDGIHESLDWSECEQEIQEFKKKYILPTIIENEIQKHSMLIWLETLKLHSFYETNTSCAPENNELGPSKDTISSLN